MNKITTMSVQKGAFGREHVGKVIEMTPVAAQDGRGKSIVTDKTVRHARITGVKPGELFDVLTLKEI